jgi:predicted transcriptional regulator
MKKTLTILSILFFTVASHAQTPENQLSIDGKVNIADSLGIGTTTPEANLDVIGTVKITDGTEGEDKVLTSDSNGFASWQAFDDTPWNVSGNNISNNNTGNVGIGTPTPVNKLSVEGKVNITDSLGIGTDTPVNDLTVDGRVNITDRLGIGTATPPNEFSVVGEANITDKLGIGIVNPVNELSVEGKVNITDSLGIGTETPVNELTVEGQANITGKLGIGTETPLTMLDVVGGQLKMTDGSEGEGKVLTSDEIGLSSWQTPSWTVSGDDISNTNSGNVGIDEPNPSEKLEVNGRIKAKGYKNTIYQAGGLNAGNVTLSGNNWQDVPSLSKTFTLDEATTVMASYTISTYIGETSQNGSSNDGYSVTRMMIDGTEVNRNCMGINDGAQWEKIYHNHNGTYFTELAAGTHTIKIQYRTNVEMKCYPEQSDTENRFLQVLVFGSN